jgi:tripartite-type tricarboxylate transporter receptor subunit TctC
MSKSYRGLVAATLAAAGACLPHTAIAQGYPVRPVRIIVPAAPGGGVDIMARLLAKDLSGTFGQQFLVDNRSPFVAGVDAVAKAPADGHMLLVTTATYLTNAALQPKLPYHPIRDLAGITLLGTTPIIICVHPALPVNSLKDLVALAKRRPGELNYGSGGNGSALHLAGELFDLVAGVKTVHVAYKGTAPAAFDLLAGQVQIMYPSVISMNPYMKSGRVKTLAVLSPRRSPAIPDIPTTVELGYPDFVANIWFGFLAPRNTPRPVLEQLYAGVVKSFATADMKDRLARDNVDPVANTPDEFEKFAAAELAKWTKVIRSAGIKVE